MFFEDTRKELECQNFEIKLENCSILQGDAHEIFTKSSQIPTCFMKTDVNQQSVIQITFMTRKPLTEVGIINYKGDKSSSYGIKGLVIVINSVTIFSGDLSQNTSERQDPFSLRLFISPTGFHSSTKSIHNRQAGGNHLVSTGLAQRRTEQFPSLVKHKSQDISLTSQQSDGSSGKVQSLYKIKKHPRVASSINNLFKFGDPKQSDRSKSSQRARIVDRSNKLQSESNYLSLFSKLYFPLERKRTDEGSLVRDISNLDELAQSNRTMVDGGKEQYYDQGMPDYGLPPHPSRKSLYMVDLLKRNMSMNSKTSTTEKKLQNKSKGPLVDRVSFIGEIDSMNASSPKFLDSGGLRTSGGALKIFQKVSEDIVQKKNSASLRTSFGGKSFRQKSVSEFLGVMQNTYTIPELPAGSSFKITLWSNWGDSEE
jgi:hypothetical protein